MRVAFLYNRSAEDPANAAEDEVPACSPVVAALQRLGHRVMPVACTLDLSRVRRRLQQLQPEVVFNRVESLGGSDSTMAAVTLLLDAMALPYTGNSTAALVGTASKMAVKKRLLAAGLPTPGWVSGNRGLANSESGLDEYIGDRDSKDARYILKSDLEHASLGIDDASIVAPLAAEELRQLIHCRESATGRTFFAEEYIDGREFNLSIMGDPPTVLPPAEIDFSAFPTNKPRIVNRDAKWATDSFEYHHTPRRFVFPASDQPLVEQLKQLTIATWRLFELRGYARVDFRCDAQNRPWILEINTNPCLAPEAGFAAALEQSGIGYDGGLQQILDDALKFRHVVGNQDAIVPTAAVNRQRRATHASE